MKEEAKTDLQGPDRSVPPPVHDIDRLELQEPAYHRLSNRVPVHEIHGGDGPAVKVELMFQAGTKYQEAPGLASAANELLKEGTPDKSSREIAEALEYYGISLDQNVDRDHAWIGSYVLSEYLEPVLQLLSEILENASFPQEEVTHYVDQRKDELLEDREKVSFLAKQRFMPVLFGSDHPYGQTVETPELFDQLQRDRIEEFYRTHYRNKAGLTIIISGRTEPWMIEALDRTLGKLSFPEDEAEPYLAPPPEPSMEKEHWVEKEGALQAALRMGKPLFGRKHPDFPGMVILTTLLGGYFGSRLMMNIREDKGYTYGVGAACIALQDSGFFALATEVGSQVRASALEEIRKEVRALQEEPVGREELEHVRRYMEGSFLRSADGPFAKANLFKNVHRSGLDFSFYDELMKTLHTITPERLMELAQEHLKEEEIRTVIAGDPKT